MEAGPGGRGSWRSAPEVWRSRSWPGHRDPDAALRSDLGGPLVAGVRVPDHARARVIGEHPLQLLRRERGAVGEADLPGVNGAADADAAAMVDADPGRAGRSVEQGV